MCDAGVDEALDVVVDDGSAAAGDFGAVSEILPTLGAVLPPSQEPAPADAVDAAKDWCDCVVTLETEGFATASPTYQGLVGFDVVVVLAAQFPPEAERQSWILSGPTRAAFFRFLA